MSKNIFFLLLSAILFFSAKPCLAQNSGHINYTINDNWRFTFADDPNSSKPEFADRAWERVNIPHTWNLKDVFDDEFDYRRGGAWYRRSLPLDARHRGKRIFLYFEGTNQIADVFVNGEKAGQHIGGYTAFVFDITDLVRVGGQNLIAVRVDNSFNPDIPPLTADFNFYGGIYRNVRVIAVDPVHIKITDHASSGLQISTPEVNGIRNTVRILGKLENASGRERNVQVVSTILDAQGRRVGESTSNVKARPDSDFTFNQIVGVPNPKLWSPDSPYLYTIKTIVKEKGRVLDSRTDTVGFRWFNFDPEKGFFLNGKPMMLNGTNRHQDISGMGNAVPDGFHVRDLEIIKAAGFNFVRLAHYPQSPSVLQAADRLGLLVWEEIPLVNYITISPTFNRNSEQMLVEMIRQHRNHASIIMWGYMNEIFLRVPKENEENIRIETVKLAKVLNEVSHREDPTRPTTIAFHGSEIYNTTGLGDVADITGWNLYSGWYSKTFEDFGTFIDDQHKRYPKRPLIISEYGANGDQRLHSRQPRRFDSTIEYQRMFHESYISQIRARPFIAGTAIWNQFDFAVEARGETIPHLNQKGMYTYDRKPKDIHYLYKANLSKSPVLHIATRDWALRGSTTYTPEKIEVYSNLPEVELFHNGSSLGKKKPEDLNKATWSVEMFDGKNPFVAKGFSNGKVISDSTDVVYKFFFSTSDEIAINVGSNAQFIDDKKTIWLSDNPYRSGSWGYLGESIKTFYSESPDRNVLGTLDDPLFQTMQENLEGYRFDVPAGDYQVDLLFTELKTNKPGERVFSLKINGEVVIDNLDLAKSPGFQQAFIKQSRINTKGGLDIEFIPIKGKPIISGIKVMRIAGKP